MTAQNDERQYWLWVTNPEHYHDEDGNENKYLEPRDYSSDAGGWWTCSSNTKKGDFALLWRTLPKCDIKYLIQADSDAYPLGNFPYAKKHGWRYGCDYRPLYKFENPITITDLKSHERLQEWNALKAKFRRLCMKISQSDWKRLNDFAARMNPRYKKILCKAESVKIPQDILLEEQLEEALVKDLRVFKKFGYDLELYYDKENGKSGRQFICGYGGRIDLLCRNKKTKGYTIIELKNVQANNLTVAQIGGYISYVRDDLGKRKKVDGIVISRGYDASFQQNLKLHPGLIRHIDLKELGFE